MNLAVPIAPIGKLNPSAFMDIFPRGYFKRAGGSADMPESIARKGGDTSAITRQFGVDLRLLGGSDNYLPYSNMIPAMDYWADTLDFPFFGFELGLSQSPEVTGALAILLFACPTVGEGLTLVARYMAVHAPSAKIALMQDGASVRLSYEIFDSNAAFRRQVLELSMIAAFNTMRAMAGPEFSLDRVDICADPPSVKSNRLEDLFGAPVHFDQAEYALYFPASFLKHEIDIHNLALHRSARLPCEALCSHDAGDSVQ